MGWKLQNSYYMKAEPWSWNWCQPVPRDLQHRISLNFMQSVHNTTDRLLCEFFLFFYFNCRSQSELNQFFDFCIKTKISKQFLSENFKLLLNSLLNAMKILSIFNKNHSILLEVIFKLFYYSYWKQLSFQRINQYTWSIFNFSIFVR